MYCLSQYVVFWEKMFSLQRDSIFPAVFTEMPCDSVANHIRPDNKHNFWTDRDFSCYTWWFSKHWFSRLPSGNYNTRSNCVSMPYQMPLWCQRLYYSCHVYFKYLRYVLRIIQIPILKSTGHHSEGQQSPLPVGLKRLPQHLSQTKKWAWRSQTDSTTFQKRY